MKRSEQSFKKQKIKKILNYKFTIENRYDCQQKNGREDKNKQSKKQEMGNGQTVNHNQSTLHQNESRQHPNKLNAQNQSLNQQIIEMKELTKHLLTQHVPLERQKQLKVATLREKTEIENENIFQKQNEVFIRNQCDQNDNQNESVDNRRNQERSMSQYRSFRSSFMSDQTQSSVYLQPPQFVLRSPALMNFLNQVLMEFFDFSQFLADIAICLYRFAINFVFVILAINFIIVQMDYCECLNVKNGGFIALEKWLMLDFSVSGLTVILLWIQKQLTEMYRIRLRRMKISRQVSIVQTSWLILYAIKYFVLNGIGGMQFFTYIFNHKQAQGAQYLVNTDIAECPSVLNYYLMGVIVFNYMSVIFLGVFLMEHIL